MQPTDWGALAIFLGMFVLSIGALVGKLPTTPGNIHRSSFAGIAAAAVGMALLVAEARVWPDPILHSLAGALVLVSISFVFGQVGVSDLSSLKSPWRPSERQHLRVLDSLFVALRGAAFVLVSAAALVIAVASITSVARGA